MVTIALESAVYLSAVVLGPGSGSGPVLEPDFAAQWAFAEVSNPARALLILRMLR